MKEDPMRIGVKNCLLMGAALLAFACSSENGLDVHVVKDTTVDFNMYTTYAVADGSAAPNRGANIPEATRSTMNQVNTYAGNQLMEHGLTQVGRDQNPSLVVFSFTYTSDNAAVSYGCAAGSYWYSYWYYTWDPCAALVPYVQTYQVGSLIVALADPAKMTVVWAALVQGVKDGSTQAQEVQNAINAAFEQYPGNVSTP
jgi:hypothetical protein